MTLGIFSWDDDILQDIFNARDRGLVHQIPLSRRNIEDKLFSHHDSNGVYSVKSAYRYLTTDLAYLNHFNSISLWKQLWALKIPPKVKNFVWRLCNNCLPIKDVLIQMHVDVDTMCPVCSSEPESALHTFTQCQFAQDC
ncbi:hypothetical protein Ddye_019776 [Dipteronia dyeriana]|uniref:Reverse transcriptase zinc-binding domain-containing protein n=1 Tax=Dipteronia dyeriana TaxID=168575 RepID=A0AAD9WVE7_9ROSI|nr:hypothetical protein Ddye_019776 [Dipteronia dyeriana]